MTERTTVYRFRNGSHMYGLNTPSSDEDFMEVFLPSKEDILGLKEVEIVDESTKNSAVKARNTADDVDDNRYALKRYLHLLEANNPNILETLFVPESCIVVRDPTIKFLTDNYAKVVSKKCYKTFKGYAKSQEHKFLEKKRRYDELVSAVAFLEKDYSRAIADSTASIDMYLADSLNATLKSYKGAKHNVEIFHEGLPFKVIYEKLKAERDTYGWRVHTKTFETLGYDCKFGYHLIRLYFEAQDLLTKGRLDFPFTGARKDYLMWVKTGGERLEDLMSRCAEEATTTDGMYMCTTLRETADHEFLDKYCVNTLYTHLYGAEE